jgi:hypothetical protein
MQNVTLLRCFDNAFKKTADVEAVLAACCTTLAPYLHRQHLVTTGDWYTYSILLHIVHANPAQFGHLLPIPGAFHIGLNAQQGIFLHYQAVISEVWRTVFPKKKLPPEPSPLERKYALELVCEGWKKCRQYCLNLLANVDKTTFEAILMVQLFEEHLPLSLDVYAIFLSGDFSRYEASLCACCVCSCSSESQTTCCA